MTNERQTKRTSERRTSEARTSERERTERSGGNEAATKRGGSGENGAEAGKERVFFVGGKWYSPDNAVKLCAAQSSIFTTETLYRTAKGAFFILSEDEATEAAGLSVLSEGAAHAFMDEHAAGIDKENYIAIFGEPKEG